MSDLWVIVPSRGRPEAAEELHQSFVQTCRADTRLLFAVDIDDPTKDDYPIGTDGSGPWIGFLDSHNMVQALNTSAQSVVGLDDPPFAIGFMGDDHRPRTVGWDAAYLDVLHEFGTGLVYGNDLLQGPRLPTQVAMTTDIVRALDYMAPPEFTHLWVDNFWLELGRALGRIRYLPDVVIEHMHPLAGKADWDAGYERVNSSQVADHDQAAFTTYVNTRLAADVAKVRALLGVNA